jgi:hypothetical protein
MVLLGTLEMSGVTGSDGTDSSPLPAALVAWTVNVYVLPFVRPETIALPLLDPGVGAGTVDVMLVGLPFKRAVTV